MPTDGSPGPNAGREHADATAAASADRSDASSEHAHDVGAVGPEAAAAGEGPDPLRFSRWMKESATGAVLTGVTLGLQRALERRDRPAIVVDAPGEPEGEEPLIRLQFDPDDPSKTFAVVRPDPPPKGSSDGGSGEQDGADGDGRL